MQAALGAWEKRLDASVKYFSKVVDAEIETMKVLGQSTSQLETLQTQGLIAAAGAVPRESPAEQVAREMGGAAGKGGNGAVLRRSERDERKRQAEEFARMVMSDGGVAGGSGGVVGGIGVGVLRAVARRRRRGRGGGRFRASWRRSASLG